MIARAILRDDCGNSVPALHCSGRRRAPGRSAAAGATRCRAARTGQPPRCASHTTAFSASRSPAQRSSGSWSASATARMTARTSNGFLRPGFVSSEKISPTVARSEPGALVRRGADVAVERVVASPRGAGSARRARRRCARSSASSVVARAGEVGRPVLRLAVRAHHALVAADAEVVLGRHAAGVVERLLAGQHHRALGRHHEDALGVHEHRRLGVPVRLRADVDAGDDDVDLAAAPA